MSATAVLTRRWRLGAGLVAVSAAVTMTVGGTPAFAAPAEGVVLQAGGDAAVADSYVVVFKDTAADPGGVPGRAGGLAKRYGGAVKRTYQHAVRGYEAQMSAGAAKRLAADPAVQFVQQNQRVAVMGEQNPPPSWGLDRVDQRALPLDGRFRYPHGAQNVRAYVIDSGIRFAHGDFGGRAYSGYDAVDGGPADDCNGHGTHVAGVLGGTAYGVAKDVLIAGVRVTDCAGFGTSAAVVAGIDWVTADHRPGEAAVANLSLGGPASPVIDAAVARSIADGVTYVVAAGNTSDNACNLSPARVPDAITVGATTSTDARMSNSNFGACVDLFAPGGSIVSDWSTGNTATSTMSGTSVAAPHVAGAAALILQANPGFTPQQVRARLVADATAGVVSDAGAGSPNALLYVPPFAPTNIFSLTLTPASSTIRPGQTVTTAVRTTLLAGSPRPMNLTATGAPANASATLATTTIPSADGWTTLTISTTSALAPGTYPITVRAADGMTSVSTIYTLTVTTAPVCVAGNESDVPIMGLATAESPILVTGCTVSPSTGSTVQFALWHGDRGSLIVSLIAPDGSVYPLYDRWSAGPGDVQMTTRVDLSSESANGTWRLRAQSLTGAYNGAIFSWKLAL